MNRSIPPIYLDYCATTPVDERVIEVIQRHLHDTFGNASSVHSFGRSSKVVLEESRETIARSIGAESAEIFFTSGGTEADNHALVGGALAQRRLTGRNHLLVAQSEHHAVLDCALYLQQLGFTVSSIPVDSKGIVDVDFIERSITEKSALISVMHANNETGVIQPVSLIAAIAKNKNLTFHSDTVQSVGKIPVMVNELGIDVCAISAHKIYGPKGIGAIYIRKGTELDALLHGGSQERKNRAGTENVPLIAGFAKAVEIAAQERDEISHRVKELRSVLKQLIISKLEGVIINSDASTVLPHILNVSLDATRYHVENGTLLLAMDLRGIAVSSGSACTSGSVQPSHVLLAMGRSEKTAQSSIRFSFGKFTTIDEVRQAGETFVSIVQSLPKK